MIKATYPSKDWGWAVQWIDKNYCDSDFTSDPTIDPNPKKNAQKKAYDGMGELLENLRSGNRRNVTLNDIINRQIQIENARN